MFSGEEMRYCHLCGNPVVGRYYQYTNGLTVCSPCERTAPRCLRCRAPTAAGASVSRGGVLLCARCNRETFHCDTCGEPILGAWYSFQELIASPEPRRYCVACVQSRPRCDLCHAPTGAGAVTLTDGQYRCVLCATDLVIGEPAIRLIYTDALAQLSLIIHEPLRQSPPLEVVSRRRMGETRRAYAREAGRLPTTHDADGTTGRHVLGFFVRSQGKPMIYVEAGLTRGLLLGTLAHELGHAWQSEQLGASAGDADPLISEGFAEWVAYHALLARGMRTLASRARERQDLYGRGLERLLDVEQKQGRDAVLRLARSGQA
jgi:DNA-directed RNA polymerase subunit N (RpoN/RPB10)